jgi:hypothetical protein
LSLFFYEGENIFGKKGTKGKQELESLPPNYAVIRWYKEIQYHNWTKNEWQTSSTHFSQLIWSSTTIMGCGLAISDEICEENGNIAESPYYWVVCRYIPPGKV